MSYRSPYRDPPPLLPKWASNVVSRSVLGGIGLVIMLVGGFCLCAIIINDAGHEVGPVLSLLVFSGIGLITLFAAVTPTRWSQWVLESLFGPPVTGDRGTRFGLGLWWWWW